MNVKPFALDAVWDSVLPTVPTTMTNARGGWIRGLILHLPMSTALKNSLTKISKSRAETIQTEMGVILFRYLRLHI